MSTATSPLAPNGSAPLAEKPRRPVVIIGLDGATFDLIQPWVEAGHLPNLGRLMSEGAWGRLASTEPPHSAPAWTTFATGVNPGKHGVYYFVAPSRDKERFRPVSSETIRSRRLWQLVSEQGGRVGIINVPMSYPPVPVNGYMIGDFFSPDDRSAFDNPALYEEVVRECGGYCVEAVIHPNTARFIQEMLACIDQRAKVGAYLMERHPTDLFTLVFTLLDRAQHYFWADMDPDHPLHGNLPRQMFPNAILDVHKRLDAAVGRVLERVSSDTTVLVMSDHGFRGEHNRLAVNNWLQQEGLLVANAQAANLFYRLGLQLKRWGLQKQAVAALRALIGTRRPEKLYYRSVNWAETKIIYGPGQGFYVNMRGRDTDGVVTEGEYEALRDYVIGKMKAFRDPVTGLPIVGDVLRREELYDGEAFDWAPDIVPTNAEYVNDNGRTWGFGMSKFLGAPELFIQPRELSGTHSPEGIFIAWGKGVRAGKLDRLSITDVAPTAMYALGLTVPQQMDGRVLTELFDPEFVTDNPLRYGDIDLRWDGKTGQVLTEEHEELVEDRLRKLGYL